LAAEGDQCIQGRLDDQIYIATPATVATAGTAARNVFFTAKVDQPVPTVTASHVDFRFIVCHNLGV
jgi:hypothetical protein